MPLRLTARKYAGIADIADDREALANFLRMERWIQDSPDQAGTAFRQFVRWFFQENRLVRGGLEIGGRAVDPRRIGCPILNIYATQDHLVPPSASRPLAGLTGSRDYTAVRVRRRAHRHLRQHAARRNSCRGRSPNGWRAVDARRSRASVSIGQFDERSPSIVDFSCLRHSRLARGGRAPVGLRRRRPRGRRSAARDHRRHGQGCAGRMARHARSARHCARERVGHADGEGERDRAQGRRSTAATSSAPAT